MGDVIHNDKGREVYVLTSKTVFSIARREMCRRSVAFLPGVGDVPWRSWWRGGRMSGFPGAGAVLLQEVGARSWK